MCDLYSKHQKIRVKKLYILVFIFINRIVELNNLKYVTQSEEDALNVLKDTKEKEEDYINIKLKEINNSIKVYYIYF